MRHQLDRTAVDMSRKQQKNNTSAGCSTWTQKDLSLDMSDVEMDSKDTKENQCHPSFTESDTVAQRIARQTEDRPWFAYNMKVENLYVQCGSKKCADNISGRVGWPTGGIVEMVSYIASGWKQQADALALAPLEALDFYRKQYDSLCKCLLVQIFNRAQETSFTSDVITEEKSEKGTPEQSTLEGAVERKRKRTNNAIFRNNCEIIFFKKGGTIIFRRIESAIKYAKKSKPTINRYVCILPKTKDYTEKTWSCIKMLRKFDSNFINGSEIQFNGTLRELQKELMSRLENISLDQFCVVKYTDETENEGESKIISIDDDAIKPPAKKIKTNQESVVMQESKASTQEENLRSGVEEDTESEDSSDSETENAEEQIPICKSTYEQVSVSSRKRYGETAKYGEDYQNYKNPDNVNEWDRPPNPFIHASDGTKEEKRKR